MTWICPSAALRRSDGLAHTFQVHKATSHGISSATHCCHCHKDAAQDKLILGNCHITSYEMFVYHLTTAWVKPLIWHWLAVEKGKSTVKHWFIHCGEFLAQATHWTIDVRRCLFFLPELVLWFNLSSQCAGLMQHISVLENSDYMFCGWGLTGGRKRHFLWQQQVGGTYKGLLQLQWLNFFGKTQHLRKTQGKVIIRNNLLMLIIRAIKTNVLTRD